MLRTYEAARFSPRSLDYGSRPAGEPLRFYPVRAPSPAPDQRRNHGAGGKRLLPGNPLSGPRLRALPHRIRKGQR